MPWVYEFSSKSKFSQEVNSHAFLLRCVPKETEYQHVIKSGTIIPGCWRYFDQRDGFGNTIFWGEIIEPHNVFSVLTHGIVDYSEGAENVCNPVFRFPTRLTTCTPEMLDFALSAKRSNDAETVANLAAKVRELISYTPGSTNIATSAQTAFENRYGVCQDISHVLIACLRGVGIAARYVSGYVEGLTLSHAWTEAYYNGTWHGIDATENRTVSEGYIKIADGRDASDCSLNRGVFSGGNIYENLEINISVKRI